MEVVGHAARYCKPKIGAVEVCQAICNKNNGDNPVPAYLCELRLHAGIQEMICIKTQIPGGSTIGDLKC